MEDELILNEYLIPEVRVGVGQYDGHWENFRKRYDRDYTTLKNFVENGYARGYRDWLKNRSSNPTFATMYNQGFDIDNPGTYPDSVKQDYERSIQKQYVNNIISLRPQKEGEDRVAYLNRIMKYRPDSDKQMILDNLPDHLKIGVGERAADQVRTLYSYNPLNIVRGNAIDNSIDNRKNYSDYEQELARKTANRYKDSGVLGKIIYATGDMAGSAFGAVTTPFEYSSNAVNGVLKGQGTSGFSGVNQGYRSPYVDILTDPSLYTGGVGALKSAKYLNKESLVNVGNKLVGPTFRGMGRGFGYLENRMMNNNKNPKKLAKWHEKFNNILESRGLNPESKTIVSDYILRNRLSKSGVQLHKDIYKTATGRESKNFLSERDLNDLREHLGINDVTPGMTRSRENRIIEKYVTNHNRIEGYDHTDRNIIPKNVADRIKEETGGTVKDLIKVKHSNGLFYFPGMSDDTKTPLNKSLENILQKADPDKRDAIYHFIDQVGSAKNINDRGVKKLNRALESDANFDKYLEKVLKQERTFTRGTSVPKQVNLNRGLREKLESLYGDRLTKKQVTNEFLSGISITPTDGSYRNVPEVRGNNSRLLESNFNRENNNLYTSNSIHTSASYGRNKENGFVGILRQKGSPVDNSLGYKDRIDKYLEKSKFHVEDGRELDNISELEPYYGPNKVFVQPGGHDLGYGTPNYASSDLHLHPYLRWNRDVRGLLNTYTPNVPNNYVFKNRVQDLIDQGVIQRTPADYSHYLFSGKKLSNPVEVIRTIKPRFKEGVTRVNAAAHTKGLATRRYKLGGILN